MMISGLEHADRILAVVFSCALWCPPVSLKAIVRMYTLDSTRQKTNSQRRKARKRGKHGHFSSPSSQHYFEDMDFALVFSHFAHRGGSRFLFQKPNGKERLFVQRKLTR